MVVMRGWALGVSLSLLGGVWWADACLHPEVAGSSTEGGVAPARGRGAIIGTSSVGAAGDCPAGMRRYRWTAFSTFDECRRPCRVDDDCSREQFCNCRELHNHACPTSTSSDPPYTCVDYGMDWPPPGLRRPVRRRD